MNYIKKIIAVVAISAVAFVAGLLSFQHDTVNVQTVAGELTPGPSGSGTLGDWSTLSHGVYCWQHGVLAGYNTAKVTATNSRAKQNLASTSLACANEDVRLYGDSITFGGKSAFAAALNTKNVMVDAWSGRPTTPIADAICAESDLPPVVIVASGTNDIFNPTVMAGQINRIKACIKTLNDALPTTAVKTKLFWVDVQATRWSQTDAIERNDQRNSEAINYAIWNNLENGQIIQWSARFLQNPGLIDTYLTDGVHPKVKSATQTVDGYAYWAATLKGWLTTLGGI